MATTREQLQAVYDVHGEKFRFLVVGVWNTVFAYVLFAALLYLLRPVLQPLSYSSSAIVRWIGTHYYLVVQWVAWVLSVPQSTTSLKYLVFRSRGHWLREVWRSLFVYLPMQAMSSVLLWFFAGVLGLNPLLGQFFTACISAVLSYLGHKNFTFKTRESTS